MSRLSRLSAVVGVAIAVAWAPSLVMGCSNLLVTKGASVDGSTMIA